MPTAYEITLTSPTGTQTLFAYAQRKTLPALARMVDAACADLAAIVGVCGATRTPRGIIGIQFDSGWTLRYSGRTMRSAQTVGELPSWRAAG